MSIENSHRANDPFFEIMAANYGHEVKMRLVASDPTVRAVIGALMGVKIKDKILDEECRDGLEGYIHRKYGVEPERSEEVFDLSERLIQEERTQRGEA